ncbi:MAG TPA: flagellar basal body L-ring protein FlgH [Sphingopyxis sp.]|nr:flagellar basal body L-ring protein FlgH [Sphingopyxis sp.]HMP44609.1 flagellar basal body L-ring protein FlgH [Sphingopyxis sp.]HMQ18196.1 flagellar basal body L-ring protein FlgH [Sphingopyxis sp.]
MRPRLSKSLTGALFLVLLALPTAAGAKKDRIAPEAFSVTLPEPPPAPPANGSIFQGAYVPLTSGARAGQVGDLITIQLVERTVASKSNSAGTTRDGSFGLTPPSTGPLSLFDPSDIAMGGGSQFKGKGEASQSNLLSGEVSVTIAAVYPNGTMLVKGEKLVTLNRGDERVQISGIVRAADISPDNRVLSTRVANAHIRYVGKGEIARASQQGWLQRFFSIISPF